MEHLGGPCHILSVSVQVQECWGLLGGAGLGSGVLEGEQQHRGDARLCPGRGGSAQQCRVCKYRLRGLVLAQVLGEGEDQLEYESAPILSVHSRQLSAWVLFTEQVWRAARGSPGSRVISCWPNNWDTTPASLQCH